MFKPAFIDTKEAEGDTCSISDVIPLVKKLHHKINAVERAGIVTFKTSFVNNLERYFDSKYNIASRKEYCIATLLVSNIPEKPEYLPKGPLTLYR